MFTSAHFHRQAPPNQMPPNHFHQNPASGAGPNSWYGHSMHPNRYGHSMPGMHPKDGIKSGEPPGNLKSYVIKDDDRN